MTPDQELSTDGTRLGRRWLNTVSIERYFIKCGEEHFGPALFREGYSWYFDLSKPLHDRAAELKAEYNEMTARQSIINPFPNPTTPQHKGEIDNYWQKYITQTSGNVVELTMASLSLGYALESVLTGNNPVREGITTTIRDLRLKEGFSAAAFDMTISENVPAFGRITRPNGISAIGKIELNR